MSEFHSHHRPPSDDLMYWSVKKGRTKENNGLILGTLGKLGEPWGTLGNLVEPWGTLGNLGEPLGHCY